MNQVIFRLVYALNSQQYFSAALRHWSCSTSTCADEVKGYAVDVHLVTSKRLT
jgi:hypothetical protein